jgi:hypothetical protein
MRHSSRSIPWVLASAVLAAQLLACGSSSANGSSSKTTLLSTTVEAAGTNCAAGGQRVDVGLDADGNGALDPAEVAKTVYLCDGAAGAAPTASGEDPGSNCAAGGVKLQVGAQVTYLCNGTAGAAGETGASGQSVSVSTLTTDTDSPCQTGGVVLRVGQGPPRYVCNGSDGANGAPAPAVSVTDAGSACENGGLAVQVGGGTAQYVCNGTKGADGQGVTITPDEESCEYGGAVLSAGEKSTTVCNGAPGKNGQSVRIYEDEEGLCDYGGYLLVVGEGMPVPVCNGAPGKDGACAGNSPPYLEGVDAPKALYLNTPATIQAHAWDDDYDRLTYSISGPGVSLEDEGGGEFTVTAQHTGGPYTFSVLVSDGCQLALSSFTIESVVQGWTRIGPSNFAPLPDSQSIAAFDGVPYVAYVAEEDDQVRVSKFDGSSWTDVSPVSSGGTSFASLAANWTGLYLADGNGHLHKYDGTTWTELAGYGPEGSYAPVKLSFSGWNTLYVAYQYQEGEGDYHQRIAVKKYDVSHGTWTSVGTTGPDAWADADGRDLDLVIEDATGYPYVLFMEAGGSGWESSTGKWTVMRYADGSWQTEGRQVAAASHHDHLAVNGNRVFVAAGGDTPRLWQLCHYDSLGWRQMADVVLGDDPLIGSDSYYGSLFVLAKDPQTTEFVMQQWDSEYGWRKVGNNGVGIATSAFVPVRGAMFLDSGTFWVSYTHVFTGELSVMRLDAQATLDDWDW